MSINRKLQDLVLSLDPITRIDSKPKYGPAPKDFSKNQNTFMHVPDWSYSGRVNPKVPPAPGLKYTKGTFGGNDWVTAPYSVPRDIDWVHHIGRKNGKSHVVFKKSDEDRVRNNKFVVSTWQNGKQSKFKPLPSGEFISHNPGKPTHQKLIHDPVGYMKSKGYKVHFVDDLNKHVKKLRSKGYSPRMEGNLDGDYFK